MQFYTSLAAVAALVSMVSAQQYTENPIHAPMAGEVVPAGKEYIIKWTNTTAGLVDLTLKNGKSDDLDTVEIITNGLPNVGLYYWTPDADLESGDDYAIEISNADGDINYTGQFTISSDNAGDDKEEDEETDDEEDVEDDKTTTEVPYPTTTVSGNSTTTPTGNSTRIPSRTPTAKPSATDDEESEEPSNTSTPDEEEEDTSAAAGVHSSLALVVCVLGAVLYLH